MSSRIRVSPPRPTTIGHGACWALLLASALVARGQPPFDELTPPQVVLPDQPAISGPSSTYSASLPQSTAQAAAMRRLPPVPQNSYLPPSPVAPGIPAQSRPSALPSQGAHASQPWSIFLERFRGQPQSPALTSTPTPPPVNEFSSAGARPAAPTDDSLVFARQHERQLPPVFARPRHGDVIPPPPANDVPTPPLAPDSGPQPNGPHRNGPNENRPHEQGPMYLEPPEITDGITQGQPAIPAPAVTSGVPTNDIVHGTSPETVAPPAMPLDVVATLPRASALALQEQVHRHVKSGFDLAGRRAYYSAKREFEQALRLVVEARDAQSSRSTHRQQLAEAFVALSEAEEFFVDDPQSGGRMQLNKVVVTHRTAILKSVDLSQVTPMAAMQEYFAFAQHQLTEALGGQTAAAPALYGLGKTYQALSLERDALEGLHGAKSLLMYQMALRVDPTHHLAANELGVMLARYGQFDDAKRALLQCAVEHRPAEVWHNLAVVHERLGETAEAAAARRQYAWTLQAQQSGRRHPLEGGELQDGVPWVDVSEAAANPQAPSPPTEDRQAERKSTWPWSR